MATSVDEISISSKSCPCCGEYNSEHWLRVLDQTQDTPNSYELLRCPTCTHTWLGNPPTPEAMGYFYGPNYHRAVGNAGEAGPRRWRGQLQTISRFKTGGSILDIGCSSGGFLACLKNGPWKLYGVEASQPTAERARELTGAEVFAGDIADAIFPPNSFDVITCSDVLEHLYEPREVLRRVFEWLKPGGIFYVFVPNIMSWEARAFRSSWYGLDLPRHLHHFSAKSLANLSLSVGLRKARLVTPAGTYMEQSTSILLDKLARKAGMNPAPIDFTAKPGVAWRVVRKGFRLTAEALYSNVASACAAAPSLQAVFEKGTAPEFSQSEPVVQSRVKASEDKGTLVNQLNA